MAVRLHVYHTAEGFAALHDEWEALLDNNPIREVFLTWEWQSTWWDAYQPGELWLIAGRNAANHLIGIASWFVEQPSRTLRTVGCVDVTDYSDLIVHGDYCAGFYQALARFLVAHAASFDSVSLCNIPTRSPTLTDFAGVLRKQGFVVEIADQEVCPVITLPETFDAYLESLDKKNRHELRRKLRRAEAGDEQVGWYFVGPDHDLAAETERFLSLMAASHRDKAVFLTDQKHRTFFRAIAARLAERGWLKLSFLTVGDWHVATYFSIDYDNRIGLYNSGLLPESHGHLSPGIVLLTYIIRDAIEQKRATFDFLRGNEAYKYRMGAHDTRVMELCARPRSMIPSDAEQSDSLSAPQS